MSGCRAVCPLYVWPYLRNGSSDQLRFWHAAEGRQARECAPGEARQRREYVSTPGEVRQSRLYNAIRVDSVPSCSWAPRAYTPTSRYFYHRSGWIATKLAHDGSQKSPQPGCAQGQGQGQGQRSRDTGTSVMLRKSLLLACKWLAKLAQTVCYIVRSHVLSLHALTL